MRADITFEQLWWNSSLMGFFFRSQAQKTLEELVNKAKDPHDAISKISDYCEDIGDLDYIEEMFYDESVEELAEEIGIELDEDEDEDE